MDLNFHCDAFLVLMSCEILATFAYNNGIN